MKLDVKIKDLIDQQNISGVKNNNLKAIEEALDVKVTIRGEDVFVDCENEKLPLLEKFFTLLLSISKMSYNIIERDIYYLAKEINDKDSLTLLELYKNPIVIGKTHAGKVVVPKTINQKMYALNLVNKDITFGVGPAGCGKTYLAVMYAVNLMKSGVVKKIILTRPAVEAGESLGYLPGDLKEKIDPYLRPLYDALYDALGYEVANELIEKDVIEIAPLAYMRGRTLENACILLDEAQNTTTNQMKMFLTRLGFKSKMIITGDITQIDLPKNVKSGLVEAIEILNDINEIGITKFTTTDVIRHLLVAKILQRYER